MSEKSTIIPKATDSLIFGQKYESFSLTPEFAIDLIEEAHEKQKTAGEPDIECVLDILDKVSQAWSDSEYIWRKKSCESIIKQGLFSQKMIDYGMQLISLICSKEYLINSIELELGSLDFFDEGVISSNGKSKTKIRSLGPVLHLNQSPVFVEVIEDLVAGIITRNANIVKPCSAIYDLVLNFIRSIRDFDPTGLIWSNQAVLLWNDNDKLMNEVFNNGKMLINHKLNRKFPFIKKMSAVPNTKLIENTRIYSFAIIEGKCLKNIETSDFIRPLAMDICLWDQKSVFSPLVIYVVDKDLKTAHTLVEALFDEMIQAREDLPTGKLSFRERFEIRKLREIARMKQVKSMGRLVCPEDFCFTFVLDYGTELSFELPERSLIIKRVSSIEEMSNRLKNFSSRLLSAKIYCNNDSRDIYEKELLELGVNHIMNINANNITEKSYHSNAISLKNLVELVFVDE